MLRVSTRAKCPEDNLRELTGSQKPKLLDSQREGKKTEREKERERELSCENCNLRCSLVQIE